MPSLHPNQRGHPVVLECCLDVLRASGVREGEGVVLDEAFDDVHLVKEDSSGILDGGLLTWHVGRPELGEGGREGGAVNYVLATMCTTHTHSHTYVQENTLTHAPPILAIYMYIEQ